MAIKLLSITGKVLIADYYRFVKYYRFKEKRRGLVILAPPLLFYVIIQLLHLCILNRLCYNSILGPTLLMFLRQANVDYLYSD